MPVSLNPHLWYRIRKVRMIWAGGRDHRNQGRAANMLVKEKLGPTGLGLDLLRASVNVGCSYELTTEEFRAKVSLIDMLVVRRLRMASSEVARRARVGSNDVDLHSLCLSGMESRLKPYPVFFRSGDDGTSGVISLLGGIAEDSTTGTRLTEPVSR
jgi:hypothetical protein